MTDYTWTTSDGREVLVSEMTDRHLINALKWLQRHIQEIDDATDFYFHPFWGPRGEMAQYYAEQEMEQAWERQGAFKAWHKILTEEVEQRGLTVPSPPAAKPPPEPESIEVIDLPGGGQATIARLPRHED